MKGLAALILLAVGLAGCGGPAGSEGETVDAGALEQKQKANAPADTIEPPKPPSDGGPGGPGPR